MKFHSSCLTRAHSYLHRTFSEEYRGSQCFLSMLKRGLEPMWSGKRGTMSDGQIIAQITLVEAPGCHLCEEASETLLRLAESYPMEVVRLDSSSDRGRHLLEVHRSPMTPLILIDGQVFSWGRLSERKLAKVLQARSHRARG